MNPATTDSSRRPRHILRWFRARRVGLLAIPLALTTLVTPFASSPFGASAPATLQSSMQDRLHAGHESFFGTTKPHRPSSADHSTVELGLRFKATAPGTVTAIRFYKGFNNHGNHVGNLWDESGNLLGSVTFANETSRGWQEAALSEPVHLKPGASYVVSYLAPRGHFSADRDYFATAHTTASLYAFADSEANNGVFKYGGGFPTSSYKAMNYYVDVLFTADDAGEEPNGSSTTTSDPATTTTTAATTTTTAATTSTTQATTTTTAATTTTTSAQQGGGGSNSTSCNLSMADQPVSVAFCDSFDSVTGADPATRSGDLDARVWGVSRLNNKTNPSQGQYSEFMPATLTGCGATQTVTPPRDVRVCNGRMIAAARDGGNQMIQAMYPKQPFDIAGRTGTVVFDVSADSEGGHAAWPEFWWTDQPVPAPHAPDLSALAPYPRNSFGFEITRQCGDVDGNRHGTLIGIGAMRATRNYAVSDIAHTDGACITKGTATGALNHFEVRVSQSRIEVYGTDAGSSTLKLMSVAENADLSLTRGLVWVENVHYNACKEPDTQCDHEFAFDNVGFDGPKPYRDLSFDVPDANSQGREGGQNLGWSVGQTPLDLETVPVYRLQTPTSALVTFTWWATSKTVPSFRLNGGPVHTNSWPFPDSLSSWRSLGVTVPVSEVHDGVNTISFTFDDGQTALANVNVILVAGSPVP